MALMAGSAWAGGGAQRFADDLAGQRTALQRAWTVALEAAAELVAKTGGGCFVPPVVSTAMPAARVPGRMVGVSVPELAAMIGQVSRKRPSLTRPVTAGQPLDVLGTKCSQDRECHAVAQLPEWVTPIPAPYLRPEDVTLSVGAQPLVGPGNAGQRPGPRPHPCRRRGRHPADCHPGQRPAAAAGRRGASSRRVKGLGTRGTLRNLCPQTITRIPVQRRPR